MKSRRCDFSNITSANLSSYIRNNLEDSFYDEEDYFDEQGSSTLSKRVLILNQSYEPLTTCSAKKALVLLYLTKADLIESRKELAVHTVSQLYPYPSVIRLVSYKRVPFRQIEISRRNIFKRDNHSCQYCGAKGAGLTIDHVLPKSRGGEDTWENLVTACFRCNNVKGNKTPSEAGMKMMSKPTRPSYVMFLNKTVGSMEESWRQFMYM